jgi:hypothetical protein
VAGAKLERNVSPITCCYCLMLWRVPWKKFLVYGSGDVSKHASPNHSRASLNLIVEPRLYMLLRFQKVARGNYGTGNQAFSMHLRFLTIRVSTNMMMFPHFCRREKTDARATQLKNATGLPNIPRRK